MQDDTPLRPATREEIEYTLSYGLRFGTTGKAHRLASEATARIAAQVLVNHLEQSGFVLMKKPPAQGTAPLEWRNPNRLDQVKTACSISPNPSPMTNWKQR